MKPIIAMSTLRGVSVADSIKMALQCGFTGIEIQTDYLPEDPARQEALFAHAKGEGLQVSLHAPCGDINITALNKGIREESIRQVKQAIDLAARYDVKTVTFHPGRLSSARENTEEKWAVLLQSAEEISRYAMENTVTAAIENMEARKKELVFTVEDLNRFSGLANTWFGVTLDLSHFATNGIFCPETEKLLLPIKNIHVSQCRDGKPHIPLQEGGTVKLEWLRGYKGSIVLELKSIYDPEIYKESRIILEKLL